MIIITKPELIAPYLKDASNFSGGMAEEVIIPETSDPISNCCRSWDGIDSLTYTLRRNYCFIGTVR